MIRIHYFAELMDEYFCYLLFLFPFDQFYFIGRELATLHHICVSYLPELQRIAKTNASIKKLVTVTDMLTTHKLKYREMIS